MDNNPTKYVCYSGEFFREDQAFLKANRAFKYADGCFESMRAYNGVVRLKDLHMNRLRQTLDLLSIDHDEDLFKEIDAALVETTAVNGMRGNCRLRLTVFRSGEGTYLPTTNKAAYLIEVTELSDDYQLNEKGLSIELAESIKIQPNIFSNFKLIASNPYILLSLERNRRKIGGLIALNTKGELVESHDSNLFIVKGDEVYTPPLSSGCLDGVMRRHLLSELSNLGIKVHEKDIIESDLDSANEIFLSNSIKGVTWVASYHRNRYFKKISQKIIDHLRN